MSSAAAAAADDRPRRRLVTQLWFWVLIAIALGIAFGLVAPDQAEKAKWLADAFIQIIQAITGPVIFTTVVIGVASIGSLRKAGGLAGKSLLYFFGMTVVALALGLLVGNLIAPGSGFDGSPDAAAQAEAKAEIGEAGEQGIVPFITDDVLPDSFVQPFVENEILRILVLGIVTAAAISFLADKERKRVVAVFEVISRIVFGVIRIVMWAAPLGAFGGMAYTVAEFGSASLASLGALMVTFWGTCAIFVFVHPRARRAAQRLQHLPVHPHDPRRAADHRRHVVVGDRAAAAAGEARGGRRVAPERRLVIPTGYSFNLDGTCIYLTLAALFIVQATGQDMAIGEQIALAALMILTSKGAAGITGAGLVTLVASLQAFGGTFFSAESIAVGIALVVGIDRIMSEGRALTNCIGNGVATMVIAKWVGERDDERFQAALRDPRVGGGRDRARAARRDARPRGGGPGVRRPLRARAGARPRRGGARALSGYAGRRAQMSAHSAQTSVRDQAGPHQQPEDLAAGAEPKTDSSVAAATSATSSTLDDGPGARRGAPPRRRW